MFYYLRGELAVCEVGVCVIDCGGIGYKLTTSAITSQKLANKVGQNVRLFTHLAVREDGVELFGFDSSEERACFNLLIGVNGVGPKAAISILSLLSPDALSLAICTEDTKTIAKASGIGPKTAARVVLELKDKISKDTLTAAPTLSTAAKKGGASLSANLSTALEALVELGFDKNTALGAIKDIKPDTEVTEIVKTALKKLSR